MPRFCRGAVALSIRVIPYQGIFVQICSMERIDDEQTDIVRARFKTHSPNLDAKGRRLLAPFETRNLGYGGTSRVSKVTGAACSTIGRGLIELYGSVALAAAQSRSLNSGPISRDSPWCADWHATGSVRDD